MLQSQLDILNEPDTNPFESNSTSSDVAEAYPTLQLLDSDHKEYSDIEILWTLYISQARQLQFYLSKKARH